MDEKDLINLLVTNGIKISEGRITKADFEKVKVIAANRISDYKSDLYTLDKKESTRNNLSILKAADRLVKLGKKDIVITGGGGSLHGQLFVRYKGKKIVINDSMSDSELIKITDPIDAEFKGIVEVLENYGYDEGKDSFKYQDMEIEVQIKPPQALLRYGSWFHYCEDEDDVEYFLKKAKKLATK